MFSLQLPSKTPSARSIFLPIKLVSCIESSNVQLTMIIRKLKIQFRIVIMVFAIYVPFCFIGDGINLDYFDISTPEKVCKQTFIIKIILTSYYFIFSSILKLKIAHCPEKYIGEEINAKEFFIFNSNIVWCNVFKSASTR